MRRVLWLVLVAVAVWVGWALFPAESPPEPAAPDGASTGVAPAEAASLRASAAAGSAPAVSEPAPPAAAGMRRVRVIAVGPPDRPEPDATIEAWTIGSDAGRRRVRTAPPAHRTAPNEAWFSFPEGPGLVWVRATADRGRLVGPDGLYVDLASAGEPAELRVPLLPAGRIEALVVDEAGRRLAGARILGNDDEPRGAPTDRQGRARIDGLVGDVFLHAVHAGHATSRSQPVVLAPDADREVTFVCAATRPIVGRAIDERGIALLGRIAASRAEVREEVALGPEGAFRFEGLPEADDPEHEPLGLIAFEPERTARASASDPARGAGAEIDLGAVRFESRWTVPFVVVSAVGEPLPDVAASVISAKTGEPTASVSNATTRSALAAGRYRLEAKPFSVRPPGTLEVSGPWREEPFRVVLEDAFVVAGRCTTTTRSPRWPLVFLRARGPRGDGKEEVLTARLDAEGRFRLVLPEWMRTASIDVETPYATLVSGLLVPKDGGELVIPLPPEQTLTLTVRAVDAAGQRVPFRWGRFERVPRAALPLGWFGGPSADGELTFWPVPSGDYRANVETWDGPNTDSEVTPVVRDGDVIPVPVAR